MHALLISTHELEATRWSVDFESWSEACTAIFLVIGKSAFAVTTAVLVDANICYVLAAEV